MASGRGYIYRGANAQYTVLWSFQIMDIKLFLRNQQSRTSILRDIYYYLKTVSYWNTYCREHNLLQLKKQQIQKEELKWFFWITYYYDTLKHMNKF